MHSQGSKGQTLGNDGNMLPWSRVQTAHLSADGKGC